MNLPHLGCSAGEHWACSVRNITTIQCGCPCHRYGLDRAFEFQGVYPHQLAAIGYR